MNERFSASTLKNPVMPDEVIFSEKGVTFRARKIFSSSENFVFYNDIAGVEIDSGIFFSTIRIKARAREHEIVIKNFTKGDARKVKELILERAFH
ncbi:PH domain-containing protein [Emticicia sp. BO119]|uniref:PH domain-containing protein n=1 Tax=Emticicia sp. BO119 TaxID=2757768 RepID=UPI0015F00AE7|nr:PH domain-containing protein [Emticicia sp. BO119]MBA4848879.1 PH domain-containing protein [Emticicia sp. BO119]